MRKVTREDMELGEDLTPMQETLEEVKATLRRHFEIKDWRCIELIMAMAVAHYTPGEMFWCRIIGPSRSGRTELLRAIAKHPDCANLEFLTPAAIRGGFKTGDKVLNRINGKLVITKDLATLLTTRSDVRTEILGLLRPIKDGNLVSDFGTPEGYIAQEVKFDWMIATTEVFERYRTFESLLGERFIDMRWRPGNREEMAYRAGLNNPFLETTIRPEIATCVCSLLTRAQETICDIELSDSEIRIISGYADKTAKLRTPVESDRYSNVITYPEPEIGTDLTQGFCRIVKGLKLLGLSYEGYLNRLLWDCMPKMRNQVIQCLLRGQKDEVQIATTTNISQSSISFILQDLRLLGLVEGNDFIMQLHINT